MNYALRDGISVCAIDNRLLFLDIEADRYFALGRETEGAMQRLLAGAPVDVAATNRLAGLVARNILRPAGGGQMAARTCAPPPRATISLIDLPPPLVRGTTTLAAGAAIAASIVRLQRRPLRANLMTAIAGRPPRGSIDQQSLLEIAAAFERAGRLISAHDRCLAQSLAVIRRIKAVGGWAQVVMGVALGPFSAHCWVQYDDILVNDRLDRIAPYTPILVL